MLQLSTGSLDTSSAPVDELQTFRSGRVPATPSRTPRRMMNPRPPASSTAGTVVAMHRRRGKDMTKHVRAAVLLGVALPAAAFAVSDVREQACEATAHRRASRLLRCMAGCRAREEEAAANGTAFDGAACEAACEARHPDTPRPGCPPAPIPSFDGIDAR